MEGVQDYVCPHWQRLKGYRKQAAVGNFREKRVSGGCKLAYSQSLKCTTEKPKSLSSIPLQFRSSLTASPCISTPRPPSPGSFYTGPTPYHLVLSMLVSAETPSLFPCAASSERTGGFVCSPASQLAATALPNFSRQYIGKGAPIGMHKRAARFFSTNIIDITHQLQSSYYHCRIHRSQFIIEEPIASLRSFF